MERNNGVTVALIASMVITLAWLFLSAMAALGVTLIAGAGVVIAAVNQRRRDK